MLDRKKEQHTKNNRSRKNSKKEGKALYKLMKTTKYEKTMENLRNRTNVKLVSNKKDYLKWRSIQTKLYVTRNI